MKQKEFNEMVSGLIKLSHKECHRRWEMFMLMRLPNLSGIQDRETKSKLWGKLSKEIRGEMIRKLSYTLNRIGNRDKKRIEKERKEIKKRKKEGK